MTTCRRFLLLALGAVLAVTPALAAWQPLPAVRPGTVVPAEVPNVIVMIPDGCAQSTVTLARWMRGAPLAVDRIQSGAVRTHSASSLVTDSAAAATALACGVKTANGVIGVAPPQDAPFRPANLQLAPGQPLASVLEAARRSRRATGLVVTTSVTDATPAAFAAHADSRRADDDIAEQLVHQDLDVVFGGGRGQLLPATAGGARRDGLDLLALLRARGVQVVGDAAAMERVTTGRVWGIFAPGPLAAEMDRVATAPEQPSLAQMTAKAIRLLQQNPHGFFLLVEGSQVDRANHANDPARAAREFLAFDDAVEQVLAFAAGAGRNRTLVIACPDHDTGGLSIGQRERTPQSVADLTAPLAGMQLSTEALATKIGGDRSADNIIANVEAWWSLRLAPQAVTEITNRLAAGIALDRALGEAVSRHHTAVGWTSSGHTGVDVPLWSFGPGRPVGLVDNTDIARSVALALRADLPALTRALFVDAREAFPQAQVDRSDKAHPALVVGTARLPLNGNILLRNGREQRFEGVVVDIEKTGRTYLPRQAADLLRVAD